MSKIGIKLANHDFFPIIDDDGKLPIEKELELTTVRDNQESVQINLFKKDGDFDPIYVASLIIEDLKQGLSGDATITLKLKLDEEGNLSAEAIDKDSKNKQSLSISMNALDQSSGLDFDFDAFDGTADVDSIDVSNLASFDDALPLEDEGIQQAEGLGQDIENFSFDENTENEKTLDDASFLGDVDSSASESVEDYANKPSSINDFSYIDEKDLGNDEESEEHLNEEPLEDEFKEEKSGFPTWLKIFLIILVFGLLVLVVALFLKNKIKPSKYEVETVEVIQQDVPLITEEPPVEEEGSEELGIDELTTEAPQKEAEPFPIKEADSMIEGATSKNMSATNDVNEQKENVKVVKEGAITKAVQYRLKWGDTLWDISGNYYKNPWAYKRIARYNKIKNPNKIIAGRYITIPAK